MSETMYISRKVHNIY